LEPRPLELTCTVAAFTWGLTQALRESFWPLYAVRAQLRRGRLYLAAVPSPHAERDLVNRVRLMRETPLRHLRDLPAAWERDGRSEVLRYEAAMHAFLPEEDLPAEGLGEAFFRLKRARADQWCAALRVGVCPTVMIRQGVGDTPQEEAMVVVAEVQAVLAQGARAFAAALRRTGQRLAQAASIATPEDVLWLEYREVQSALAGGGAFHAKVAERRDAATRPASTAPPALGPPLAPDAPANYLLPEVLELVGIAVARGGRGDVR
jgi:hypothetical protein